MYRPRNTTEVYFCAGVRFRLDHYVEMVDYVVADKHPDRKTRRVLHKTTVNLILGNWNPRDYFFAFLI